MQDPFGDVGQSGADALPGPASGREDRLVYRDGVHLFDPLAQHHQVLAEEGRSASSAGEA